MNTINQRNERQLVKKYLKDVIAWHGFVRFLGLPTLQNNPDVPLDELYVAQSLSEKHLSTDKAPNLEELISPINYLLEKKRVVVLGDPGSGKSTLINWFSWYLASGFSKKLPEPIGDLLPLTLVLRDLDLSQVTDISSLMKAFLKRPVADAFNGDLALLLSYLSQGKVLLLIDGLDEITPKYRRVIKNLLLEYFTAYPENYVICTSRVVGYEVEPIQDCPTLDNCDETHVSERLESKAPLAESELNVCYVAPFTDQQISQFALKWYRDNLSGNDRNASLLRDDFIEAIVDNPSTKQLARTPHLLTMMALIYKIKSQLPNGRALLYDLIAQAYLESIDTARKLQDKYLWQDKKRWLARVGFEMQLKRVKLQAKSKGKNKEKYEQNLLIEKSEVLEWIRLAMQDSGNTQAANDVEYASEFLDWIARRSGLLLPRGEDKFAFLHLSFQEYFAAVYIQQQIENPEWLVNDFDEADEDSTLDPRFKENHLQNWVDQDSWQQTIILLFELMAAKPGWTKKLWKECFKKDAIDTQLLRWESLNEKKATITTILENPIARQFFLRKQLLENPHSGISGALYKNAFTELLTLNIAYQNFLTNNSQSITWDSSQLFSMLMSLPEGKVIWKNREISCDELNGLALYDLDEVLIEDVLNVFAKPEILTHLSLVNCRLSSLENLERYQQLTSLTVHGSEIKDVTAIGRLKKLTELYLELTKPEDFESLIQCHQLRKLGLFIDKQKIDISLIARLKKLVQLNLNAGVFYGVRALNDLKNLETLSLFGHMDVNLKELKLTNKLKSLSLARNIGSLEGIERAVNLEELRLYFNAIDDLASLGALKKLSALDIHACPVSDLTPLAQLKKLKSLHLSKTQVKDLTPIAHLDVQVYGINKI
ncbi:NACHT domain-containing protein [Thalassomonas haliotis]|uniref:NACHT domain-containing protein n=1 Tax=Thalassomonas haliotis TaxID=485448 RepID=A0ABY7VA09_9GAMM|nr:NACHT domain-containing protein [Thalassomonas haliotis]WDE10125.1 NACHT domain-containing protein [Thalassomonas haliotis]